MKRVIIVHGWGGSPNGKDWIPWAKEKLEEKGYEVIMPLMPDSLNPKIETWVPFLSQIVGSPQNTDIFIGHSIGCQTILRYLETLEDGQKVDKIILVAPWGASLVNLDDSEDEETAKPWLETPINWEKIKTKANSFVALFCDNDPYVPLGENKPVFEEKLGVKSIIQHNQGHFTEDDGTKELPILLELL